MSKVCQGFLAMDWQEPTATLQDKPAARALDP